MQYFVEYVRWNSSTVKIPFMYFTFMFIVYKFEMRILLLAIIYEQYETLENSLIYEQYTFLTFYYQHEEVLII